MADILRKVEAENPDIVVSTGDLVDGDMKRIEALPALFGKLRPRLGKYAITGNHEVYAGLAESLQAERAFGFTVLSGEVKTVDNILNIVGVDDPATGLPEDEKAILGEGSKRSFYSFSKAPAGSGRRDSGSFRPAAFRAHALWPVISVPIYLRVGLPPSERALLSFRKGRSCIQAEVPGPGARLYASSPPLRLQFSI